MPDNAINVLLAKYLAGDKAAVTPLFESYFHRLVALARKRLRNSPRPGNEEDVALSAFASFCRKAEAGRYPGLADRDGLWALLADFTFKKAGHRLRYEGSRPMVAEPEAFEELISREPDPALVAELAEECDRHLAALNDTELQRVAVLRMEGFSVDEISAKLGCAPRSVKRKLHLIRREWGQEGGHERQ